MKQELSWGLSGKESICQCGRHGFDPWSRKILDPCTTTIEAVLQSLGTTTTEPWSLSNRGLSPCSTREATAVRSPCTATRESPQSKEDPAQPKINKQIFLKVGSHDICPFVSGLFIFFSLSLMMSRLIQVVAESVRFYGWTLVPCTCMYILHLVYPFIC